MTAIRHLAILLLLSCAAHAALLGQQATPDSVNMNDGRTLHGLILKNTAQMVLLQTPETEMKIPKSEIRRIHDNPDPEIVYAQVTGKGKLPAWRAMVLDMREHDSIHSLQQIPATAVDTGIFKNVPYLSFRVNEQSEFNVYGDPNNPVALEFGIYGKRRSSQRYQQIVREFLAGHLDSRKEIDALYSISLKGGKKQVGPLIFEITPPREADAYGGWWISVYDPERVAAARVSDAKYAAITRPFLEVSHRNGRLRAENHEEETNWLSSSMEHLTGMVPKVRGFYRDKDGVFRVITFESGS